MREGDGLLLKLKFSFNGKESGPRLVSGDWVAIYKIVDTWRV